MSIVTLDFESYYDKDYSLKKMSTQAYIMDPRFKIHGFGYAINGEPAQWVGAANTKDFLHSLDLSGHQVVAHNAIFDCGILAWRYNIYPGICMDTLGMSRAILGDQLKSHSLDSVSQFLLGKEKSPFISKMDGVQSLDAEQERGLARYCRTDVELCRDIFFRLLYRMTTRELLLQHWCIKAFTYPRLILDKTLLKQHYDETIALKEKALLKAQLTNRKDLMSNPKFARALEDFGVIPPRKISKTTGRETYAFAKTDLGMKALEKHSNPAVQALVAARMAHKSTIEETRAKSYLEAAEFGPWPVHYWYCGATQTHRFSGGNGAGGNPQNLKRGGKLRQAIMAPAGSLLVVGDLSQIELRITLGLAGETKALEFLAQGGDLYKDFATKIYKNKIEEVTEEQRQIAKSAMLGLGFGMGATRFIDYVNSTDKPVDEKLGKEVKPMDEKLGKEIVYIYRDTYSGVKDLWSTFNGYLEKLVVEEGCSFQYPPPKPIPPSNKIDPHKPYYAQTRGIIRFVPGKIPTIKLPSGLHIQYPGLEKRLSENGVSEGWTFIAKDKKEHLFGGKITENVVQALARCILMEQLLELDKHYPVVMTTHDELVCMVRENETHMAVNMVKEIMSTPPEWWPELPLATKVTHAKRYGDAK